MQKVDEGVDGCVRIVTVGSMRVMSIYSQVDEACFDVVSPSHGRTVSRHAFAAGQKQGHASGQNHVVESFRQNSRGNTELKSPGDFQKVVG